MSMRSPTTPLLLLLLLLLALAVPASARAQAAASTLSGTVVDTAGKPISGLELALHRVAESAGAPVGRATSDPQGHFRFEVPAEADPGAVFFVATRYQGDLYIGPTFSAPYPPGAPYTLTVGANPIRPETGTVPAPAGPPVSPQVASQDARAGRLFFAVLLGLAALAILVVAAVRWRRERVERRRRALVLEVARLDERCADRAAELPPEEAESYRRRRAALAARAVGA